MNALDGKYAALALAPQQAQVQRPGTPLLRRAPRAIERRVTRVVAQSPVASGVVGWLVSYGNNLGSASISASQLYDLAEQLLPRLL